MLCERVPKVCSVFMDGCFGTTAFTSCPGFLSRTSGCWPWLIDPKSIISSSANVSILCSTWWETAAKLWQNATPHGLWRSAADWFYLIKNNSHVALLITEEKTEWNLMEASNTTNSTTGLTHSSVKLLILICAKVKPHLSLSIMQGGLIIWIHVIGRGHCYC